MSFHIVIGCESDWFGFDCRGKLATTEVSHRAAWAEALTKGWSMSKGQALCPAHTFAAAGQGRTDAELAADHDSIDVAKYGTPNVAAR
jgi:hypothetical protein